MKSQKGDNSKLLDIAERDKYIDISYNYQTIDWYKPHEERYTDVPIAAKQCA